MADMYRCSICCNRNGAEQCSCRPFHGHVTSSSVFFAARDKNPIPSYGADLEDPLVSSSVDCTLSLGPPSTRQSKRPTTYMSNLFGDFFRHKHASSSTSNQTSQGGTSTGDCHSGLARWCANCGTTSTPLWRNGPKGPKSLCNACGIRYKKEERRATSNTTVVEDHQLIEHHRHHHHHNPWSYTS